MWTKNVNQLKPFSMVQSYNFSVRFHHVTNYFLITPPIFHIRSRIVFSFPNIIGG